MDSTELTDLWITFKAEHRQQMTHLWTELLYRQLQAQRLRQTTGGSYERLIQD